jgi:tyrosine-protein phosphatase YwqE
MFNFFTKHYFLADHLEGLVDIHNHILPGIDDGAKTVADSLDLLKGMEALGITDFICTPHIMDNYYPNTPKGIGAAEGTLKNALAQEGLEHMNIRVAAEHMIDSNFEHILDKGAIMPLAGSYLLIEMSYLQPSLNLLPAVEKISDQQLYPILAHPERYAFLHGSRRTFAGYKDKGMLLQMNLLSLSAYYGKEVQKAALRLLDGGLIDFMASDIHNTRQLHALKEIKLKKDVLEKVTPILQKTAYNFAS